MPQSMWFLDKEDSKIYVRNLHLKTWNKLIVQEQRYYWHVNWCHLITKLSILNNHNREDYMQHSWGSAIMDMLFPFFLPT